MNHWPISFICLEQLWHININISHKTSQLHAADFVDDSAATTRSYELRNIFRSVTDFERPKTPLLSGRLKIFQSCSSNNAPTIPQWCSKVIPKLLKPNLRHAYPTNNSLSSNQLVALAAFAIVIQDPLQIFCQFIMRVGV